MSYSSPSSSSSFSPPDHQYHQTLIHSNSDQLCYVHCNFCDTVLAVSVPSCSLFKTVTVRCGHCTNLLSVNMRAVLDLHPPQPSSLLEEIINSGREIPSHSTMNMMTMMNNHNNNNRKIRDHLMQPMMQIQQQKIRSVGDQTLSKHHTNILAVNKPPEKKQRVPSAYNRFIKEEIHRIKAGNPDISHRQAFSAAAKNWAHFPHIHFGLMSEEHPHPVTKPCQLLQETDEVLMHNGMFAPY